MKVSHWVTSLHVSTPQEAELIVTKIKQQQYNDLLSKDQLNVARNDGRVFLHFGEAQQVAPSLGFNVFTAINV